jgi:hypothetical protein
MTAAPTHDGHVAMFQFAWPVQSHTINAAIVLAEAGYTVDLFLFNAPSFVNLESLSKWDTVHVHDLTPTLRRHAHPPPAFLLRLARRVRGWLRVPLLTARQAYWLWPTATKRLVPQTVLTRTMAIIGRNRYSCLIGIEKRGLIWAGRVAERLGAPLVYYNLELYTKDYINDYPVTNLGGPVYFRRVREAEGRYHRRAAATIVQTRERARALCEDTGVELSEATIFYVPVSVLGAASCKPATLLHDLLGLPKDQKIVLYFGHICAERYAMELTRAAQRFHDDWTLVMHGWGEPSTFEQIRNLDKRDKVALSLEMVDSDRIGEVVSSAAAGIVLYRPRPLNDRLTAFASEKMALYMQHRLPFVSFDYKE